MPSSFRDPSGFVFLIDGVLYRQVNRAGGEDYDRLMESGLYSRLVRDGLLVAHEEVDSREAWCEGAHRVLRPEPVPFVSYPYEWSFSQLKDAALATLRIQREALDHGMSLKDCSGYNIQFRGSRPVLIDTLSFERYVEGRLWAAYGQFCRHFLAPLALMSYVDARLSQLLRAHVDGIPLDLASSLLPFASRLRLSLLWHIHLHGRNARRFADRPIDTGRYWLSKTRLTALVDSLGSAISGLRWRPRGTGWSDYYAGTSYSPQAFEEKARLVAQSLEAIRPTPRIVWDLGANTGLFSRLASRRGIHTVSFDADHACVEESYRRGAEAGETHLLPLWLDLANPSPGLGWAGEERTSLVDRGPADAVMALALVHHLAIGNNLPQARIAGFLSRVSRWLIIEFVPREDSQVRRLLANRADIFQGYTQQAFDAHFGEHFEVVRRVGIGDSQRTLYLMRRREAA